MPNRILVIVGPTSVGKTNIALHLAPELNAEIVSSDSRQVYKYVNIGTGKDIGSEKFIDKTSDFTNISKKYSLGYYKVKAIPIWLLDILEPKYEFSVAHYLRLALKVIKNIQKRGKQVIIVGGTGLYIQGLLEGINTTGIPPNLKLRKELNTYTLEKLQKKLIEVDPIKFSSMNNSDKNNPRRLIRAIEIGLYNKNKSITKSNDPVQPLTAENDSLIIGLRTSPENLKEKIATRIADRLNKGVLEELNKLLAQNIGIKHQAMATLGYRQLLEYINGKTNKMTAVNNWKTAEYKYAKRQITWFNKMKNIVWYDINGKEVISSITHKVSRWNNQKAQKAC